MAKSWGRLFCFAWIRLSRIHPTSRGPSLKLWEDAAGSRSGLCVKGWRGGALGRRGAPQPPRSLAPRSLPADWGGRSAGRRGTWRLRHTPLIPTRTHAGWRTPSRARTPCCCLGRHRRSSLSVPARRAATLRPGPEPRLTSPHPAPLWAPSPKPASDPLAFTAAWNLGPGPSERSR